MKESEIQEKDNMLKLLSVERDQALATLNKHGLMADRNAKVGFRNIALLIYRSIQLVNM